MIDAAALPIAQLIPHQGNACWIERVLAWDARSAECLGRIPAQSPHVERGLVPCVVGLELAAQAAAVLEALLRRSAGGAAEPRRGYLVGVQQASFLVASLPAERRLRARVECVGGAPPLAQYEARVDLDGVDCLLATLSTYVISVSAAGPKEAV